MQCCYNLTVLIGFFIVMVGVGPYVCSGIILYIFYSLVRSLRSSCDLTSNVASMLQLNNTTSLKWRNAINLLRDRVIGIPTMYANVFTTVLWPTVF